MEDRWENALSEAYENLTGEPRLELRVVTLNINEGHNKELLAQCQILREYAQYVAKVRKYTKEMDLDAAVERAVDECIREGILRNFLRKNRAEVIAMSIFEYDKEEEEKKLRRAEYEAGYGNGIEVGEERKAKEIIQLMLNAGETVEKIAQYTGCTVKEIENTTKTSGEKLRESMRMSIFEYDKEEEEKKLRKAEYEAGKEHKAKETAALLFKEGDSIEKIARVLNVDEDTIHQWIEK